MTIFIYIYLFFSIAGSLFSSSPFADEEGMCLYQDLEAVEEINKKINDELPLLFSYTSQPGYFVMPSARSSKEGRLGVSYSYVPPYTNINVNFQFFNFLEVSGNYRTFLGITDPTFGHLGYGDVTDRAVNVKANILSRQENIPFLPEIAVGLNDFMGSRYFRSWFIVATKSFLLYNLEITGGWANGRMNGFYGGLAWSPWRQKETFLKNLTFAMEYDCNDYKNCRREHKDGRAVKLPMNFGVHYRLFDVLQLSCSSLRGKEFAASASLNYNLGKSEGVFPKTKDPPIYISPIDNEPLGDMRSDKEFSCQLAVALKKQGFALYSVKSCYKEKKREIWLKIVNLQYRYESITRERIQNVLAALLPSDVYRVKVLVESDGLLCHEYIFRNEDLQRYFSKEMGKYELAVISPMIEIEKEPNDYESCRLYRRNKSIWTLTLYPKFKTYFGSAKGKFKYDLGIMGGPDGYLFNQIYYNMQASYVISSSAGNISAKDTLNPSKIINVRSDTIRYYQSDTFHIEKAYVQKSWNLTKGWFLRLSAGYFEVAYAGVALEGLYYPVGANWAVGVEVAPLLKREYSGLGFTDKIYRFNGVEAEKVDYNAFQYFLDLYYKFKPLNLDFKISIGQFLAKDKGVKIQMGRTFSSGLTAYMWYSFTTAEDIVNGDRYFDKGIGFTMPLDIFMNKSAKSRVGYAMSAWLRDVGARARTGKDLYPILYYERQN